MLKNIVEDISRFKFDFIFMPVWLNLWFQHSWIFLRSFYGRSNAKHALTLYIKLKYWWKPIKFKFGFHIFSTLVKILAESFLRPFMIILWVILMKSMLRLCKFKLTYWWKPIKFEVWFNIFSQLGFLQGPGKTMYIVSACFRYGNDIFGKLSWPNLTFLSPSPSLLCFPLT